MAPRTSRCGVTRQLTPASAIVYDCVATSLGPAASCAPNALTRTYDATRAPAAYRSVTDTAGGAMSSSGV